MEKEEELELISYDESDLPDLAGRLLEFGSEFTIFAFYGEMGSGKTTFIKALCEKLGVEDEVSSPTFSLVNEYLRKNGESVFHFDFYRIEDEEEAMDIGIEEYLSSGEYCFMEWCENIPNLLPAKFVGVYIQQVGNNRIIKLQKVSNGFR